MAEYRLSPRAQRDLGEMFDYTAAHWGLSRAVRYTDLVEAACADLAEAPQQAQGCDHIRPGYRRRSVGQHVIYFRPTDRLRHRRHPHPAPAHGHGPSPFAVIAGRRATGCPRLLCAGKIGG